MPRNTLFHPDHEPMRNHASLQLLHDKVYGPFSSLNPTQAHFQHTHFARDSTAFQQDSDDGRVKSSDLPSYDTEETTPDTASDQPASNVAFKWTSRNNRKGRHALVVKPTSAGASDATYSVPRSSSDVRTILYNMWLMVSFYPVWDISWWVAYIFTWGSVVWVINAFFSFLPYLAPSTLFHDEVLTGGGVSAFVGATIFEIGSVFLMIEAINENHEGCFGWAVERSYEEHVLQKGKENEECILKIIPDKVGCRHHHQNKKNLVGKPAAVGSTKGETEISKPGQKGEDRLFRWFCSRKELQDHYLHDLGFIACSAQMFGASVFWISGFTALPGINNNLSPGLLDGIYWTPQVIGGSGFIVSGILFMIETQKHWWQPAPTVLGWHIGMWNLIGGLGFTLCPCFGFDTNHWSQYQASCSTFWGSCAFLIGSLIQLYESIEKNPVEMDNSEK